MGSAFSFSAWATILRAGNSLTGFFGVAFGAVLVLGGIPQGSLAQITLLHSISVWCFMCSWNALNDILDVKIDEINRPNRPLPSGVISLSQAKFVTGLLMMVSLGSLIFAGNIVVLPNLNSRMISTSLPQARTSILYISDTTSTG